MGFRSAAVHLVEAVAKRLEKRKLKKSTEHKHKQSNQHEIKKSNAQELKKSDEHELTKPEKKEFTKHEEPAPGDDDKADPLLAKRSLDKELPAAASDKKEGWTVFNTESEREQFIQRVIIALQRNSEIDIRYFKIVLSTPSGLDGRGSICFFATFVALDKSDKPVKSICGKRPGQTREAAFAELVITVDEIYRETCGDPTICVAGPSVLGLVEEETQGREAQSSNLFDCLDSHASERDHLQSSAGKGKKAVRQPHHIYLMQQGGSSSLNPLLLDLLRDPEPRRSLHLPPVATKRPSLPAFHHMPARNNHLRDRQASRSMNYLSRSGNAAPTSPLLDISVDELPRHYLHGQPLPSKRPLLDTYQTAGPYGQHHGYRRSRSLGRLSCSTNEAQVNRWQPPCPPQAPRPNAPLYLQNSASQHAISGVPLFGPHNIPYPDVSQGPPLPRHPRQNRNAAYFQGDRGHKDILFVPRKSSDIQDNRLPERSQLSRYYPELTRPEGDSLKSRKEPEQPYAQSPFSNSIGDISSPSVQSHLLVNLTQAAANAGHQRHEAANPVWHH